MAEDTRPSPRRRRREGVLRAVSLGALAVLLLAGLGTAAVYARLEGNISRIDLDAVLGADRPEDAPNGSLDILVLGSDHRSRPAQGAHRGGEGRADTAMVLHINEERDAASVVSIPRDTLVARPACARPEGRTAPPADRAMFNEAYTVGGPACTVKTVESMTGLRMDHYLEVDFQGFTELIDALGGVEVTTTKAIHDEDSHLHLPPGTHTLDGREALALVRTRKGVGDGSDLGRIQLQHAFLRALADRVGSAGLLAEPTRLYELADTATSAVTTDSGIASVRELAGLAATLRGIGPGDMQLVTLPVSYDDADPNRVVPLTGPADRLWKALKRDEPVPASVTEGSAARDADPGGVIG